MNSNQPLINDNLAEAIVSIAETLKHLRGNPHMNRVVVALVMGSPGASHLKKKYVEFVVEKIFSLEKVYKADEIIKMKKLLS